MMKRVDAAKEFIKNAVEQTNHFLFGGMEQECTLELTLKKSIVEFQDRMNTPMVWLSMICMSENFLTFRSVRYH